MTREEGEPQRLERGRQEAVGSQKAPINPERVIA
jgi:hypothetical protein